MTQERSRAASLCLRLLALMALCGPLFSWAGETQSPAPVPSSAEDASAAKTPWQPRRLRRIVRRLGDERFAVRDAGSRELTRAPVQLLPQLTKRAAETDDPEIKKRLTDAARRLFLEKVLPYLAGWKIGRGFLGIQWVLSEKPPGVRVARVIPGTAAERAGLRSGDVIVHIDGKDLEAGFSYEEAIEIWRGMAPGDSMTLEVQRVGVEGAAGAAKRVRIKARIGEIPRELANEERDREKARKLWARYLEGYLKIPEKVLHASGGRPAARSQTASAAREKSAEAGSPLQSWPAESEAPRKAP